MTMEEDWVWLPHKAAVPAVYMAISVSAPKTSAFLRLHSQDKLHLRPHNPIRDCARACGECFDDGYMEMLSSLQFVY